MELIFRGFKMVEFRKSRVFGEGDIVFFYVVRGNFYEFRDILRRFGFYEE